MGKFLKSAGSGVGNSGQQVSRWDQKIAVLARQATADGQEIIDFFLSVMRGKTPGAPDSQATEEIPLNLRIEAAKELRAIGWGKTPESVNIVAISGSSSPHEALMGQPEDVLDKLTEAAEAMRAMHEKKVIDVDD